jgi:molybdopterin molybdotransferase
MLHAFLTSMGARPVTRGVLPDDPGMIARALAEAGGDLIVTTGGTGPGSRDVLAQGLSMAGAGALFRGVLMKPGRHTSAFLLGGRLVLGLSGPPTAALAGFQALVKPVVLRLMGLYDVNPPGNKARLDGEVRPSSLETLLPVTLHGSGPWARPAGPGECPEALLVVPRGAEGRHGEVFPVLLLD